MAFSGVDKHLRRLRKLHGPEVERRVGLALKASGEAIKVDAQISITAGSVSGKNHEPSLPGEPPNNDTNVLRNNIESVQKQPLLVEVSSSAPYAAALEFGTSKMAARPYMDPAGKRGKPIAERNVQRALDSFVRTSGS